MFTRITAVLAGLLIGSIAGCGAGQPNSNDGPQFAKAPFDSEQAKAHQQAWSEHLDADVEITNSMGMKFMLIPPGEFMMGAAPADEQATKNERPRHRVRITQPFYLVATEVTQGQWIAVMETQPWQGQRDVAEGTDVPAVHVRWEDAVEFCRRLSTKEGKEYRLPTEAEWEYACRAGTQTAYHFGDEEADLGDYGLYWELGGENKEHADPVAQRKPNAWGLFDMHGNVCELCSDWSSNYYYAKSPLDDPPGNSRGDHRVIRGGAWPLLSPECRSSSRSHTGRPYQERILGFRVVLEASPSKGKN